MSLIAAVITFSTHPLVSQERVLHSGDSLRDFDSPVVTEERIDSAIRVPREIIRYGNRIRTTTVHFPPDRDPAIRLPLVIVLHGLMATSESSIRQTGFED
ncbi:MAG: hypothetical protein Q8O15_10335, partial [Rectinemataceae bacterium]|nr:hypothetical protein [Rectinemataceae bacterium]